MALTAATDARHSAGADAFGAQNSASTSRANIVPPDGYNAGAGPSAHASERSSSVTRSPRDLPVMSEQTLALGGSFRPVPRYTASHGNGAGSPSTAPFIEQLERGVEGVEAGLAPGDDDDGAAEEDDEDDLSTSSGRRHGNLLQPEPEDYVVTESPYMTHWFSKRHLTGGNPKLRSTQDLPDWRMRERLRTVTAALVMCLNIGVDPPDVSKTNPCSKLICWMDPTSLEVSKALPAIGKNLQAQFETLSMKTRYKQYLDPIVEETKRFCTSLRRTAKDERVLFYYNGYGVPKPTPGGEIWVFNKAYTQYIPVTLYDLQTWLGNPCIFVWDASAAGNVVVNFKKLAERRAEEEASKNGSATATEQNSAREHFPLRESIHLAACAPDEVLPMNPDLPADLFTCCLTSPIEISLRWFVLQNPLPSKLDVDMVMDIPGRLSDRRTPLGELNWIFTAITDTIAWTVLPRDIFRRLFRDDLMVAALLRNFLLAERIMRFYHCTPMSHPKLPPTNNHPLWTSWDLAVDQCLAQLPTLLEKEKAQIRAAEGGPPVDPKLAAFEYRHSTFFSEQLKAFEVWLSQGGVSRQSRRRRSGAKAGGGKRNPELADDASDEEEESILARQLLDPPDQLPIVLQVLLSQVHRLRALILLSQFLDLGPRAVNLALSIGIFPYVLKLLQSPAMDLKPVLIYIWARILAVDRSCQNDLLRDSGFTYFVGVLSPFQHSNGNASGTHGQNASTLPIPNVSEHRAMCAFILSVFCQDFPAGQQACLQQTDAMDSCLEHLEDDDFLLRQWSAICLAQLWDGSDEGKAMGIRKDAHGKLCYMLGDVSPEVRAAVLYALGTLLGASGGSVDPFDPIASLNSNPASSSSRSTANAPRQRCLGTGSGLDLDDAAQRGLEIGVAIAMLSTRGDCSPMVRKELVIALSALVREYKGFFVLAAYLYYSDEEQRVQTAQKGERERQQSKATAAGAFDLAEDASSAPSTPQTDRGSTAQRHETLLARVLSKLALEEGLKEEDIANVPAFSTLFVSLLDLSIDAHTEVAGMAKTVVDYILALLLESEVARASDNVLKRLEAGAGDSIATRFLLPTGIVNGDDSYFSYAPQRSSGQSSAEGFLTPHGTAFALNGELQGQSAQPRHSQPQRRATSLAQTVKAIATLGYSRPASPVPSPEQRSPADASPMHGGTPHSGAATTGRVPAPRFNVMGYTSPYTPGVQDSKATAASPSASPSPSSTSAAALLARRSASAESLAHIARRQQQQQQQQQQAPTSDNSASASASNVKAASASSSRAATPSHEVQTPDSTASQPGSNIRVADALAALIAVDLQRFANRAALAFESSSMPSSAGSTPMPSPSSSRTAIRTLLTDPGLGNDDIRETLPLKSRLFNWCSEYYREPQMKPAEAEEPGSVKYNIQTWKRQRNERIVADSSAQAVHAAESSWTQPVSIMRNGSAPYLMLMHQFENHLVTASEKDVVTVWDWKRARLLSRFHNGNAQGTNITTALFINEEVDGLLLVGSAEGDVRLYRNYDKPTWIPASRGPELISTFRALPDLVRSRFPSGFVADWQQVTGHLLAGGDSRVIRIWDAHRELCVCDIPTRTSSCVTSISSESDIGHIFVAGFGNGTVAVYDRRNPPEASLVRLWEEHQTWVHKVHLQKRGNRELVSASDDGEVRLWDIRGRSSISKSNLGGQLRGKLSAFAVHERIPVFAAASTPRLTRLGSATPQQILMAGLSSPLTPLGASAAETPTPIVRHFASTMAAHSNNHQHHSHGHHAGNSALGSGGHSGLHANGMSAQASGSHHLPPAVLDSPLSNFTPAMASVAMHPHWPMVAYAGPDLAGTIEIQRLSPATSSPSLPGAGGIVNHYGHRHEAGDVAAAMGQDADVAMPTFASVAPSGGGGGDAAAGSAARQSQSGSQNNGAASSRRSWIMGG
ncbi:unnamed protein product [Parajaminaea phylloscopi]